MVSERLSERLRGGRAAEDEVHRLGALLRRTSRAVFATMLRNERGTLGALRIVPTEDAKTDSRVSGITWIYGFYLSRTISPAAGTLARRYTLSRVRLFLLRHVMLGRIILPLSAEQKGTL